MLRLLAHIHACTHAYMRHIRNQEDKEKQRAASFVAPKENKKKLKRKLEEAEEKHRKEGDQVCMYVCMYVCNSCMCSMCMCSCVCVHGSALLHTMMTLC